MNVTSKGRYALHIMIYLAQHSDEGYISLKTISDRTELSMKYLEMIVGNLKKAQLVDSTRGKEGGYKLIRRAETAQDYFATLDMDECAAKLGLTPKK